MEDLHPHPLYDVGRGFGLLTPNRPGLHEAHDAKSAAHLY